MNPGSNLLAVSALIMFLGLIIQILFASNTKSFYSLSISNSKFWPIKLLSVIIFILINPFAWIFSLAIGAYFVPTLGIFNTHWNFLTASIHICPIILFQAIIFALFKYYLFPSRTTLNALLLYCVMHIPFMPLISQFTWLAGDMQLSQADPGSGAGIDAVFIAFPINLIFFISAMILIRKFLYKCKKLDRMRLD